MALSEQLEVWSKIQVVILQRLCLTGFSFSLVILGGLYSEKTTYKQNTSNVCLFLFCIFCHVSNLFSFDQFFYIINITLCSFIHLIYYHHIFILSLTYCNPIQYHLVYSHPKLFWGDCGWVGWAACPIITGSVSLGKTLKSKLFPVGQMFGLHSSSVMYSNLILLNLISTLR